MFKKPPNNNQSNLIPWGTCWFKRFLKEQKTTNNLMHKEISVIKPFTEPITIKTLILTKENLSKIEINRKTTIKIRRIKI